MSEVKINKDRLKQLFEAEEQLQALHAAGVDNWDLYPEAVSELFKKREREERVEEEIETLLRDLAEHIDAPAGWQAGYGICGDEPLEIVKRFLETVEEIKTEE